MFGYWSRNPFHYAFSFAAWTVVLLAAGSLGYDMSRRVPGSRWTGAPVWWEIGCGLACFVCAAIAWRRAMRSLGR